MSGRQFVVQSTAQWSQEGENAPRIRPALIAACSVCYIIPVTVFCRVTGGQSLHAVWKLLCGQHCRPFGLSAWIVVFSSVQLFLSQVSYTSHPLTARQFAPVSLCCP